MNEKQPPHETHKTTPSYFLMVGLSRHYLPEPGQVYDVVAGAEDIDEDFTEVQLALEALRKISAVDYQDADESNQVLITEKNPQLLTPGAYMKKYPEAGPINPIRD